MKKSIAATLACLILASVNSARSNEIAFYNPDTLTTTTTPTPDSSGLANIAPGAAAGTNLTIGGNGPPVVYGRTTTGYDTVFNDHNYISYNQTISNGLLTGALFSGNNARTVVGVYDTPTFNSQTDAGSFNGFVAGQASPPGGSAGLWFGLESRQNNVTGNPYLVNYGPDISSGQAPVAHQLTFALGTYDGAGTESLYWAYGVTGAVQSATVTNVTLNTNTNIFTEGSAPGEAGGQIDVGDVVVFNSGLSAMAAMAEIESLQAQYMTPEPSSLAAICSLSSLGLFMLVRRRRKS